jgi:Transglutaminase-like superfamily
MLVLLTGGATREYTIDWREQRVGHAQLTMSSTAGRVHFDWHATIGVAGPNCLRVEESKSGSWLKGSEAPVPEEIFLGLGLADGCRAVLSDSGLPGKGCLAHHGKEEIRGDLLGQPFVAKLGSDGLPDQVELPSLAITYRKSVGPADVPCPGPLGLPQPLLGGETVRSPRRILHSEFRAGGQTYVSARAPGTLPAAVAKLVARAFEESTGKDCKLVAGDLARGVRRQGIEARTVAGFLWDGGQLWPHAWNELLLPKRGWVAVDATTGSSFADAGRLTVGSLEPADALATGLHLLSLSAEPIRVVSYDP